MLHFYTQRKVFLLPSTKPFFCEILRKHEILDSKSSPLISLIFLDIPSVIIRTLSSNREISKGEPVSVGHVDVMQAEMVTRLREFIDNYKQPSSTNPEKNPIAPCTEISM